MLWDAGLEVALEPGAAVAFLGHTNPFAAVGTQEEILYRGLLFRLF